MKTGTDEGCDRGSLRPSLLHARKMAVDSRRDFLTQISCSNPNFMVQLQLRNIFQANRRTMTRSQDDLIDRQFMLRFSRAVR